MSQSPLIGAALAAVVNLAAAGVCAAEDGPDQPSEADMKRELQILMDQIDTLQRRLDRQLEVERQNQVAAEAAAKLAASARAEAAAIPAKVASAVDAAKPKTDHIYYKGVTIALGGFLAWEGVHRSIDTSNDIATAYNASYFANSPLAHVSQTLFSARQSSLSVRIAGDPAADTHLGAFAQFDFQGAARTANSNESNSYNPRVLQLFSSVDWDELHLHGLVGQAWSLATLNATGIAPGTEIVPATIDGQYVPGFVWTRQPQVRLTQDIDRQFWLSLSLENPQTTFYTGPNALPATVNVNYSATGGSGFNSANTLSLNHVPDEIFKLAADPTIAGRIVHLEAFVLHSTFYERLNFVAKNVSAGGAGGGVVLPLLPNRLDLQFSGMTGKGIGRYATGQLPEATFDPAGTLQPIRQTVMLAGLTAHLWTSLDLYVYAGREQAGVQSYNLISGTGAAATLVPYGYGNPLYSNLGCASEIAAGTCIANERRVEQGTAGFWYRPYVGTYGSFRWGMQYSHTQFNAFSGVGGAPAATLNMFFASFRYYPFEK